MFGAQGGTAAPVQRVSLETWQTIPSAQSELDWQATGVQAVLTALAHSATAAAEASWHLVSPLGHGLTAQGTETDVQVYPLMHSPFAPQGAAVARAGSNQRAARAEVLMR